MFRRVVENYDETPRGVNIRKRGICVIMYGYYGTHSRDNIENGMTMYRGRYEEEHEEYCKCGWCGNPIFVGDEYLDGFEGENVCEDCFKDKENGLDEETIEEYKMKAW